MKHIKKIIIVVLMLVIPALGFSYEIELTRQLNKLVADDNTIRISMTDSGFVKVIYPAGMKRAGSYELEANARSMSKADQWYQYVSNQENMTNRFQLEHRLNAAKTFHKLPLFYSSEVDTVTLSVKANDQLVWELSFNNWQELRNFKQYLGDWELMIDTIIELEQMAKQVTVTDLLEVAQ